MLDIPNLPTYLIDTYTIHTLCDDSFFVFFFFASFLGCDVYMVG